MYHAWGDNKTINDSIMSGKAKEHRRGQSVLFSKSKGENIIASTSIFEGEKQRAHMMTPHMQETASSKHSLSRHNNIHNLSSKIQNMREKLKT